MRSNLFKLISAVVICLLVITTCKKDHGVTVFEVTEVTITGNTVKVTGKVVSLSDSPISGFGVCYSTKNNPVATDTAVNLGTPSVGNFTATISNLKRNKNYYFKAFILEGENYLYDEVRTALIPAIPPTGTTVAATSVTESGATLNGSVNPNGCPANVSFEYGTSVSYGSTATPSGSLLNGETLTNISVVLTSLSPATTYHYRLKVTGPGGTAYGEDMTFTTTGSLAAPAIVSATVTSIGSNTATLNASVNANGSLTTVTFEYGTTFMYGSLADGSPTGLQGIVPVGVTASLTGLLPGQLYHFRVKAVSAGGTVNSDDFTFSTTQPPAATTLDASNIQKTAATLNGTVNAFGLSSDIYFEYGLTTSYGTTTAGDPSNSSTSSVVASKLDITGLTEGTTYHFRIKAVSSAGTSYGTDNTFITTAASVTVPVMYTEVVTNITQVTATSGGSIISDGGGSVTAAGVCWGTATAPDISGNKTTDVVSSGTFTSSLSGLTAGTTYYIRAYATNGAGTGYGPERSFSTATEVVKPVLTTSAVTDITQTTALGGGSISSDGGDAVTESGLCWNTAGNPTISDNKTTDGSDIGSFTSSMTGLTAGTTYYVKAYATNSSGTGYGAQVSFSTQAATIDPPTVTTTAISAITQTSASSGGNVTSQGGAPVTARGVCWDTDGDPLISDQKTADGSGTGSFTSSLTSLNPGTTYYVRAYATNTGGTAYGNIVTFTTNDIVVPIVTTADATGISQTAATLNGLVNANGLNVTVTFEYGLNTSYGSVAAANESPVTGSTNTAVTAAITGLTANTQYNFRVKTVSTAGTIYGDNKVFTTLAAVSPTVTTASPVTGITTTGATGGGNVTAEGSSAVTARGVCWGTSLNPTIAGSKTTDGTGTGAFVSTITGLSPNTDYHVRAYATSSAGTSYGSDVTFTTSSVVVLPTVTTTAITAIGTNSASSGGNVTSDGGATVTARGICWGTSANPSTPNTTDGTGIGSFTSSLTSLSPGTTYHVRAYATNSAGTSYGADLQFTTNLVPVAPTVTTTAVSLITTTSASSGGNVTFDGNATVTERGICWSTSANPTTANSKLVIGAGTGAYSGSMTGLLPGTTYHVRAYAINSAGTGYGGDTQFTTLCNQPSASTSAATAVTAITATLNGSINASGFLTNVTFQYGPTTAYGTTVTASPATANGSSATPVSVAISGLLPNTVYHFRVVGSNCGGVVNGNDLTFTTPCAVATATANTPTGIVTTSATLRGTVNASNASTTVIFEYGLTTSYGSSVAASPGTVTGTSNTSVSASISGLTPNTTYHFRVIATNCGGVTNSSDLTFTTACAAPTATTNAASGVGTTSATLNGTVNANYGSGTVTFQYGLTTGYGSSITAAQSPVTGNSPVAVSAIPTLSQNTTYHYRVRILTCYGVYVNGADQVFTTSCAAPTATIEPAVSTDPVEGRATLKGIVNANGNSTSVVFDWGTSTAFGNIATASPSSVSGSVNTSVSATLNGLVEGTIYYYRVTATSCYGTVYSTYSMFTLDIDGNLYHIVRYRQSKFATYTYWMKENLRATSYSDLTPVPPGCDTCIMYSISYKPYQNISSYTDIYGLLYNGITVNSPKNICPTGWHVPTFSEWTGLINYAGGTELAGGVLKEVGTDHWYTNTDATDAIGFAARGGGYATSTTSTQLKYQSRWWADGTLQYIRMSYNSPAIITGTSSEDYYYYIRCKK